MSQTNPPTFDTKMDIDSRKDLTQEPIDVDALDGTVSQQSQQQQTATTEVACSWPLMNLSSHMDTTITTTTTIETPTSSTTILTTTTSPTPSPSPSPSSSSLSTSLTSSITTATPTTSYLFNKKKFRKNNNAAAQAASNSIFCQRSISTLTANSSIATCSTITTHIPASSVFKNAGNFSYGLNSTTSTPISLQSSSSTTTTISSLTSPSSSISWTLQNKHEHHQCPAYNLELMKQLEFSILEAVAIFGKLCW